MTGMAWWFANIRRWSFNFAAGVSLLLFIAVLVFWPRSYWRADDAYLMRWSALQSRAKRTTAMLISERGCALFGLVHEGTGPMDGHPHKVADRYWYRGWLSAARRPRLRYLPQPGPFGFGWRGEWKNGYANVTLPY